VIGTIPPLTLIFLLLKPRLSASICDLPCRIRANFEKHFATRLRDQLCLLIRQHNLDPTLVKAYAADFCGTPSLKEANSDLVQYLPWPPSYRYRYLYGWRAKQTRAAMAFGRCRTAKDNW